jgi:hypothetical protein
VQVFAGPPSRPYTASVLGQRCLLVDGRKAQLEVLSSLRPFFRRWHLPGIWRQSCECCWKLEAEPRILVGRLRVQPCRQRRVLAASRSGPALPKDARVTGLEASPIFSTDIPPAYLYLKTAS